MNSHILIIGAGGMAKAMAYDLRNREPKHPVVILDRDRDALNKLTDYLGKGGVQTICGEANDLELLQRLMSQASVVISAASYTINLEACKMAIYEGAHWVDLGGNPFVVQDQFKLHEQAKSAGVGVFPDCGLAPGMINVIAGEIASRFDDLEELHLRVGGLPQFPKPPLFYGLVFSPEGLANEYHEPALVIEDGELRQVESLTGWERVYFGSPLGTLEAFHTSGGSSTLVETFKGRVKALDYKTLRYPGHLRKIKLLGDLGFWGDDPIFPPPSFDNPLSPPSIEGGVGGVAVTPRYIMGEMLKRLGWVTEDLVAVVSWGTGTKDGKKLRVNAKLLDYSDPTTGLTAMARTTGFPAVVIARMLAEGVIEDTGVLRQEGAVPREAFFKEMEKRGVRVEFV